MVRLWELTETAQLETANLSLIQSNDKRGLCVRVYYPDVLCVSCNEMWEV